MSKIILLLYTVLTMSRKKLHRFLIDSIPSSNTWEVADARVVHQIGHVLKMKHGEECIVFTNGGDDVVVTILEVSKSSLALQKKEVIPSVQTSRRLIAAIAIPKSDTFELIAQKLTELGVNTIVPLITSRTIKQSVRLDRLQTISDEALEQCGGSTRVVISVPLTLVQCLAQFPHPSIAFEPGVIDSAQATLPDTLVMYVGPEGGWSDDDLATLTAHQVMWRTLGGRILRTETATIIGAYTLLTL